MADETEGQDTGAEAAAGGVDPGAVALALSGASQKVETNCISRRRLLGAASVVAASGLPVAQASARAAPSRLITLSDWLRADPKARESGLQACLDRIGENDNSIHAWVQVRPQPPTAKGRLSGIPFGVKDIIETRGLATEYGSPIYKGRVGTKDAAIIRAPESLRM